MSQILNSNKVVQCIRGLRSDVYPTYHEELAESISSNIPVKKYSYDNITNQLQFTIDEKKAKEAGIVHAATSYYPIVATSMNSFLSSHAKNLEYEGIKLYPTIVGHESSFYNISTILDNILVVAL